MTSQPPGGGDPPAASPPAELLAVLARFEGPLPPPEFIREYNSLVPGAAERILVMAEKQLAHRLQLEKKDLEADTADAVSARAEARRGQWLGFAIAALTIIGGCTLVAAGHDAAGATIVTSTV